MMPWLSRWRLLLRPHPWPQPLHTPRAGVTSLTVTTDLWLHSHKGQEITPAITTTVGLFQEGLRYDRETALQPV